MTGKRGISVCWQAVRFRAAAANTPRSARNSWVVADDTGRPRRVESHQWTPERQRLGPPEQRRSNDEQLLAALLACNAGY